MNAWLLLTLLHLLQQSHRENFHELSSIHKFVKFFPSKITRYTVVTCTYIMYTGI